MYFNFCVNEKNHLIQNWEQSLINEFQKENEKKEEEKERKLSYHKVVMYPRHDPMNSYWRNDMCQRRLEKMNE